MPRKIQNDDPFTACGVQNDRKGVEMSEGIDSEPPIPHRRHVAQAVCHQGMGKFMQGNTDNNGNNIAGKLDQRIGHVAGLQSIQKRKYHSVLLHYTNSTCHSRHTRVGTPFVPTVAVFLRTAEENRIKNGAGGSAPTVPT